MFCRARRLRDGEMLQVKNGMVVTLMYQPCMVDPPNKEECVYVYKIPANWVAIS